MLDVGKLALLREVAAHGGVTAAARALRTSPSNVSQQLRRLERDTGVALLESRGRGVRLTAAAQRLVARTEDILAILEEAETELGSRRGAGHDTVRLAGFHTFAVGLLGSVLARLRGLAPALSLEFVQLDPEAAVEEVLSRRADIAVIDEYLGFPLPPTPGLVRTALGDEPVRVYLPEGHDDPAAAPWAMEPPRSDAAKWAIGVCHAAGFDPRIRFASPDPYVHRRLLEQGVAAAFLPATVARGLPDSIRPAASFPSDLARTHALVTRRGTLRSPAIAACRSAIQTAFEEAIRVTYAGSGGPDTPQK